jgi:hypothetical protein
LNGGGLKLFFVTTCNNCSGGIEMKKRIYISLVALVLIIIGTSTVLGNINGNGSERFKSVPYESVLHVLCPEAQSWMDVVELTEDNTSNLKFVFAGYVCNSDIMYLLPGSCMYEDVEGRNWVTCCGLPTFRTVSERVYQNIQGSWVFIGTLYSMYCTNCGFVQSTGWRPASPLFFTQYSRVGKLLTR